MKYILLILLMYLGREQLYMQFFCLHYTDFVSAWLNIRIYWQWLKTKIGW